MRKRSIIVLAGIALFILVLSRFPGWDYVELMYRIRAVKNRVHVVLQGIQKTKDGSGTVGDEQLAICIWYKDKGFIGTLDILNTATGEFDTWRKSANFYIEDYSIDNVELEVSTQHQDRDEKEKEKKIWVFHVTGTIDGTTYVMRVPENDTITWIQAPWF